MVYSNEIKRLDAQYLCEAGSAYEGGGNRDRRKHHQLDPGTEKGIEGKVG